MYGAVQLVAGPNGPCVVVARGREVGPQLGKKVSGTVPLSCHRVADEGFHTEPVLPGLGPGLAPLGVPSKEGVLTVCFANASFDAPSRELMSALRGEHGHVGAGAAVVVRPAAPAFGGIDSATACGKHADL